MRTWLDANGGPLAIVAVGITVLCGSLPPCLTRPVAFALIATGVLARLWQLVRKTESGKPTRGTPNLRDSNFMRYEIALIRPGSVVVGSWSALPNDDGSEVKVYLTGPYADQPFALSIFTTPSPEGSCSQELQGTTHRSYAPRSRSTHTPQR